MRLEQVPEQGILYALYTDKVVYAPYIRSELHTEEICTEGLLELHLFDDKTEYRYVRRRGQKQEPELTEISDETISHDDCYVERIFTLKDRQEKPDTDAAVVEVVNYITYDENDLLRIDNYRLQEVR